MFAFFIQRTSRNNDILYVFDNLAWLKPDWKLMSLDKSSHEMLMQCSTMYETITDDVDDIMTRSDHFPISFPIDSVRLKVLKRRIPIEILQRNIATTYPVVHERVLLLMTRFLQYKREYGSSIEKVFYRGMCIPEFIDRLLKKRAVSFVGAQDDYLLLSGENGEEGWESIGQLRQHPPLVLEDCLSYDELKISALICVSGYTVCINPGKRYNSGVVMNNTEEEALIIGVVGTRFERVFKMDYEDILITELQNCPEHGYERKSKRDTHTLDLQAARHRLARRMWKQMWAEFYQVPIYTHKEITSIAPIQDKPVEQCYTDRYYKFPRCAVLFDNEVYSKRLRIAAECVLLEADKRAAECQKTAYINIIGYGLGEWKISSHQADVFILTFVERTRALLREGMLNHVSDVNFAYIKPTYSILALFGHAVPNCSMDLEYSDSEEETVCESKKFFKCPTKFSKQHKKGGIKVQLQKRAPSSKLTGEHAGKLLVITYPWDSNALPGNEFWHGALTSSGDPATAASTQVAELHNAHINTNVCGRNTKIACKTGIKSLLLRS